MYSLPETLYSEFLAKAETIQRAQARQAWEATLPPVDDPSQQDRRGHMMAEMEAKDWAFREGQIQRWAVLQLPLLNLIILHYLFRISFPPSVAQAVKPPVSTYMLANQYSLFIFTIKQHVICKYKIDCYT